MLMFGYLPDFMKSKRLSQVTSTWYYAWQYLIARCAAVLMPATVSFTEYYCVVLTYFFSLSAGDSLSRLIEFAE